MSDITPLATVKDGHLCLTTYAVALILGTHPDDITNTIDANNLPDHLQQQAYQRVQEAQAHGTPSGVINNAAYWAQKEHQSDVHTDPLGQAWINKAPHELWPTTNTPTH